MYESLNRVAVIVQQEAGTLSTFSSNFKQVHLHSSIDLMPDQIRECLHSKLQRSLTRDENASLDGAELLASDEGTDRSTSCEANAAEDGLVEHLHVLGVLETRAWDTVRGGTGFGNDEVAVLEVGTKTLLAVSIKKRRATRGVSYGPEVVLCQLGFAWWVLQRIRLPSHGLHLVVQGVLTKICQQSFENLLPSSQFHFKSTGREEADIFHLHIMADASDLDEESLEVNSHFLLYSFGELAAAS